MSNSDPTSKAADKTIIITGANGNLGTAVTNVFLSKGYKVIATVHDDNAKKDLAPNERLHIEVIDLTNEEATGAFVQRTIQQHQKIDGALLLVGGFAMGNIKETGSIDIKKQLSLNFDTAYHAARPIYQHMIEQNNGRIVFIGSRPALKASDGKNMIAYSLSKSLLFKLAE